MARILLIDDEAEFIELFAERYRCRFPELDFEICTSATKALARLGEGFDLLIVDLDMPELSGRAFLDAAVAAGFDCKRIIVYSAHTADELHERFELGECLAVLNKIDQEQQAVLDLILAGLQRADEEA